MSEQPEEPTGAESDRNRNEEVTPKHDSSIPDLDGKEEHLRREVAGLCSGASGHLAGDTKPMLDVHTPHGPVHSWREFFVHIAAIAIGLLLALALEQFAAYIHERHQLTEARHELMMDLTTNQRNFEANAIESARIQQLLATDLRVIQALRSGAPVSSGNLDYSVHFFAARDGSWQATRQSGALALMPYDELQRYAWFYGILASLMNSMHLLENTLQIASSIAASAPPEKLAAHDLDELASKTMESQGRLENFRMFLGFEKEGFGEFSNAEKSQRK